MNVLEVSNLTIEIEKKVILSSINLKANKGDIIVITGNNGSGKSVLLKAIAGYLQSKKGKVLVNGIDIYKTKSFPRDLGALIESPGFLPSLTGFNNLKLLARIQNKIAVTEIHKTLDIVGLDESKNIQVRKYSVGMKQRLGFAQAIMENPGLILLDEPTNGLDKEGTKIIRKTIKQLADAGKTIVLTSHISQEIEELQTNTYRIEDSVLHDVTK